MGPGTLRQAIADAQSGALFSTRDTIVFDLPDGSEILLSSILMIDNCCGDGYTVIIGPGADKLTINGNGNPIFSIKNGDVYGVSLIGGHSDSVPAAVNVVGEGHTILNGVKVSDNTGTMGAIHMNSLGTLCIFNSIISGNSGANNGTGLKHNSTGGSINILNTTITGNIALFGGGGINNSGGGSLIINNSIVAKNDGGQGPDDIRDDNNAITFGTNLIGDVDGTNLASDGDLLGTTTNPIDPLFVECVPVIPGTGGDFNLTEDSPALNRGVNGDIPSAPFDEFDYYGNERIAMDIVELGAIEFQEILPIPTLSQWAIIALFLLLSIFGWVKLNVKNKLIINVE
jgi:hypothetical protein